MKIVYEYIWLCEFVNMMNELERFEYWFKVLNWNIGEALKEGLDFSGACILEA